LETSLDEHLRAASDSLLVTLDRLQELEESKQEIEPGTPAFADLATRIQDLAARALRLTVEQRHLSDEASDARATAQEVAPIADTMRAASVVLSDWRAAERRMAEAAPGSPEHRAAHDDVDRFRAEYQRVFEANRQLHEDDTR
jgi:formate-dependent nitrite reductase cytochrome c552 subunit